MKTLLLLGFLASPAAAQFTGTTTYLQAALDAGGRVDLKCGAVYTVTSTLTFTTDATELRGCNGRGSTTRIVKAAGYDGCAILISTNNITIRDLLVVGNSGNSGDGICVQGRAALIENVGVERMGRDGVRTGCDGPSGCNANVAKYTAVDTRFNGRWGFNWDYYGAALPDANAGYCLGCFATFNSSDGFRVNNSWDLTILSGLADHNGGYAVKLSSMSRGVNIVGGDFNESDTLGSIRMEPGSRGYALTGNVNYGTIYNDGSTPLMLMGLQRSAIGVGGSTVIGSTNSANSYRFEVWDPTDPLMTRGDIWVDHSNNTVNLGRFSGTGGSSSRVRFYGRTGNLVGEWNTNGGSVSYFAPGGGAVWAFNTDVACSTCGVYSKAVNGGGFATNGRVEGYDIRAATANYWGGDNTTPSVNASSGIVSAGVISGAYLTGLFKGSDIIAGTIGTSQIAAGAINTGHIIVGAINTFKIGPDAVTTAKILDGNVTGAKIATETIGTTNIQNGAITAAKLAASVAVGGSGTTNRHAKFTASGTVGDSSIFDTGSAVTVNSSPTITGLSSFNVVTTTQAAFYGFSRTGGAGSDSGTIRVGNNAAYNGGLDYNGAGTPILHIFNHYDNAAANIDFQHRTAGTTVTSLTLGGDASLTLNGSTFTVSAGGIVSAPSQPTFVSGAASNVSPALNGTQYVIYWAESADKQNMFATGSSDTVKIPIGGGGDYLSCYTIVWAGSGTATVKQSYTYLNGGDTGLYDYAPLSTQQHSQTRCNIHANLSAGDTLQIRAATTDASNGIIDGSRMKWHVRKL